MTDQPDMTITEVAKAARDFAIACGGYHTSSFITSTGDACLITEYKGVKIDAEGSTWREAFEQAERQLKQIKSKITNKAVPNMASAIIRLQHENGECRFYNLLKDGFTRAEVEAHSEAACKLASEMTNGLAFEIITSDETHAA